MLFLVISTPRAEQPSSMRSRQKAYWVWLNERMQEGTVKHLWNKTGRGAVVIADVPSNEELHKLINQWQELVPATFEVTPLVSKEHQERIANAGTNPMQL